MPLRHHPEPQTQVLGVALSQARWYSCKRHDLMYGGRSTADCFYRGGYETLANEHTVLVGRKMADDWYSQATIGAVRRLSASDRSTKGHRLVRRLSLGYRTMFSLLSADPWVPTVSRWPFHDRRTVD